MKVFFKNLALILLVTLVSCSKDDSVDSSLLLNDFEEPNLNFGVSREELLNQLPDQPNENTPGAYRYFDPQNGVFRLSYVFLTDLNDNIYYAFCNVEIYEYQHNLNHIKNFLTNKYGEPEIRELVGQNVFSYEWLNQEDFNIFLVYSRDGLDPSAEIPGILLTYQISDFE